MTALGAIEHTQVPEGGTLLVIGATGGVGTFAVQAAAARGIRTLATASAQHADQVRASAPPESSTARRGPSTGLCAGSPPRASTRSSTSSATAHSPAAWPAW
ncbi:hypothetical protein [Streptomyces sp. NBC_00670]|jgi:NAD(P)-dependent dehydrogenase (short-subunit alcohol dehydrogenase family)|uniref:hypothetical protein n=1 Tax=Streptomyces sp. NBC_00670 TaxID=2975804 RepID=UPI002E375EFC|nr:hypothetical protein [Streptomyces sp. NBC_00670]